MKNTGVIIAIILIIIAGAGVTFGTRRFIHNKTSGSSASVSQLPSLDEEGLQSESLSAAGLGAPTPENPWNEDTGLSARLGTAEGRYASGEQTFSAAAPEENEPLSDGEIESEVMEYAFDSEELEENAGTDQASVSESQGLMAEAASQGKVPEQAKSNVSITPLTGSDASPEALAEASITLEGFQKKLSEIDNLIQNMQASDANSNTDSLKTIADYEYRLLDTELNHIYQAIIVRMNEEEAKELKAEEREWIHVRDLDAKRASSKYKGGTMESLEYTASLADSTRRRAYELLDDYGRYLVRESDLIEK